MKVNIGCPVVRTDGGRSVYGHTITKFSGMGRFTKLWGSAHACASRARGAPLLEAQKEKIMVFPYILFKAKGYDVIGFNVFLRKKRIILSLPHY